MGPRATDPLVALALAALVLVAWGESTAGGTLATLGLIVLLDRAMGAAWGLALFGDCNGCGLDGGNDAAELCDAAPEEGRCEK